MGSWLPQVQWLPYPAEETKSAAHSAAAHSSAGMIYRFLKNSALTSVKDAHCSGKSSSKKMASTGQTSAQTPQSMHSSGLMKYCSWSSSEWMQSTGQTSTHEASFVPMHGCAMT